MYLDYWNLHKHPFNNVPDPQMYFNMHKFVDDAVSEILFAVEEGDECLAVVVGPVGVGKTMCLRIVLDTIEQSKYQIAFVTNPDMTFPQILREIVGQLEGKECLISHKDKLLERFNQLLFEASDRGQRVLIFIDEGNVIRPHNLESLRLLTNMQDDDRNLFTIILAGQPELARRLEDPRRDNLFQRIGVYCKLEGIHSRATMIDYIEHRLERAGLSGESIFSEEAYDVLWRTSEDGAPRIINKMCKLCLKAGETNNLDRITSDVVRAVAARFDRTYSKVKSARKKAVAAPKPVKEPEPAPATLEEREKIAGRLATERIKTINKIIDPFEAWTKARDEILHEMDELQKMKPIPLPAAS